MAVVFIKPVSEEELKRYNAMDEDSKDIYSDTLFNEINKGENEIDSRRQAVGLSAENTAEHKSEIQMEINLYYQETVTGDSLTDCERKFADKVKELLAFLNGSETALINVEGQGRIEIVADRKQKEIAE